MVSIAVFCECLLGYSERRAEGSGKRLFLLPLIVSVSFFLIAEIDSPSTGLIRILPQNLESVSSSLGAD
jgi:hypothetical protein